MNKAKKLEVTRERVPDINLNTGQYEIRADYGHYGIAHYPCKNAETKKSIMRTFDELLRNCRGKFVVLKPIAVGESKIVIKNYDKLPQRHYAVFSQQRGSVQYHGITSGVDRIDALSKVSNYSWRYFKKSLSLLLIENNMIKRDKFAHLEVEDLTQTDKSIFTPMKTPYSKIKRKAIQIKGYGD